MQALLSESEFHHLLTPTHPRDMHASCPQCGKIAMQHYDGEQVIPEPGNETRGAPLGSALMHTCGACESSYFRGWVAGIWGPEDILRIIDRRS
jgi:hypothetical protein